LELNQKSTETEAWKARVHELEQTIVKKEQAMTEQKRLLKKVKVKRVGKQIFHIFFVK
jgi:hypothetical protein